MNLNIAHHINNLIDNSGLDEYLRQNTEIILIGFLSLQLFLIVMSIFEWSRKNVNGYG